MLYHILENIKPAKHVVLFLDANCNIDSIASMSVIYTLVLQEHKKVSLVCQNDEKIKKLSCIPWSDKVKNAMPISADLTITFEEIKRENSCTALEIYNFFEKNSVKINKKIATALYAGIMSSFDGFLSKNINGTIFAVVSQLMTFGAEYEICNKIIMQSASLAFLRLKSIMLKNMVLQNSAKTAVFHVNLNDLKSSGGAKDECKVIAKEALLLPYIETILLFVQNIDFSLDCSLYANDLTNTDRIAKLLHGNTLENWIDFKIENFTTDVKHKIFNT